MCVGITAGGKDAGLESRWCHGQPGEELLEQGAIAVTGNEEDRSRVLGLKTYRFPRCVLKREKGEGGC